MELIWGKCEAVYFCRAIWTTQIALNRQTKIVFARSAFFDAEMVSIADAVLIMKLFHFPG